MEQGVGSESIPTPGSMDKSMIFDIRPLRCLVPTFPSSPGTSAFSSPQTSPFMCFPPTGPFPPGVSPFYPFLVPAESLRSAVPNQAGHSGFNNAIPSPVPLTSFRPTSTKKSRAANGSTGPSRKSSRYRTAGIHLDVDGYSDSQHQTDQYLSGFSMHVADAEDTGSKVRRRKGKSEMRTRSGREVSPGVDIDLVANSFLESFNLVEFDSVRQADGDTQSIRYILMIFDLLRRRITQVEEGREAAPGGLRRPDLKAGAILMNKGVRTNTKKRIGAVPGIEIGDIFFFRMEMCLVGLHAPSMAGIDFMSFKLVQGEDSLAISIVSSGGYEDNVDDGDVLIYSGQGNHVRVIRGVKDVANPTGKIYLYDGLYKIQQSWAEKGRSGVNVFKYKLVRVPGQPEAFTMWKSIQQWKEGITSRVGVILPDLTSGAENLPVSLVNDVDDEKGPAYFTYFPTLKYRKPFHSPQPSWSCMCRGGCQPGDLNCSCIQKNGGVLPYTALGVFRTKDKGWGVRSWDPIRAGAFICEYAGEVIDVSSEEELEREREDHYIFDATCTSEPSDVIAGNSIESPKIPFPLVFMVKEELQGILSAFCSQYIAPSCVVLLLMVCYVIAAHSHLIRWSITMLYRFKSLKWVWMLLQALDLTNP
ncbi:hypothetical protein RHSIM_Rhsim13G0178700 [Rhododendron simsii]|uniref:YDG domain-containing protein n=1 Tax=Rhododendron simsii TaxID=118357 RepID=A0A834L718_RHOSS|nr:hypothetical protein RHSIM_Rhsim13G0178700 [Rhododendron simsii]